MIIGLEEAEAGCLGAEQNHLPERLSKPLRDSWSAILLWLVQGTPNSRLHSADSKTAWAGYVHSFGGLGPHFPQQRTFRRGIANVC